MPDVTDCCWTIVPLSYVWTGLGKGRQTKLMLLLVQSDSWSESITQFLCSFNPSFSNKGTNSVPFIRKKYINYYGSFLLLLLVCFVGKYIKLKLHIVAWADLRSCFCLQVWLSLAEWSYPCAGTYTRLCTETVQLAHQQKVNPAKNNRWLSSASLIPWN